AVLANRHAGCREETFRNRPLRWSKVVVVSETRAPRERVAGALDHLEPHDRRGSHLHRRDTHFAVALGEVAVANREQSTLDRDGHLQRSALRDLLAVKIAPVLPRRDRT